MVHDPLLCWVGGTCACAMVARQLNTFPNVHTEPRVGRPVMPLWASADACANSKYEREWSEKPTRCQHPSALPSHALSAIRFRRPHVDDAGQRPAGSILNIPATANAGIDTLEQVFVGYV